MSKLSNGWITIFDNDKLMFSMYISSKEYISEYLFNVVDLRVSQLNGCSAQLLDVSHRNSSFLYSKIKTDNYYITCSLHNKTQAETIRFLETLLDNSTL